MPKKKKSKVVYRIGCEEGSWFAHNKKYRIAVVADTRDELLTLAAESATFTLEVAPEDVRVFIREEIPALDYRKQRGRK